MDASWSRSGCARIARVRFARAARARSRAGQGRATDCTRDLTTALLAMQTRVAAAVDHAPTCRGRLEEVVATLWSPLDDPGASRPVLALWVSERGWRPPVEARLAVGRPMPLRLLRVPFRGLTLVAIRDLFGEEFTALERARERAAWLFRRAAPRRPVPAKSPRPPALWPGGERRLARRLSPSGARNSRASRLGRRDPIARASTTARSGTADRRGPRAGFRDVIGRRGSRPGGRPTIKRERRPVVERENRRLGSSFGAFPALKRERQHRICSCLPNHVR